MTKDCEIFSKCGMTWGIPSPHPMGFEKVTKCLKISHGATSEISPSVGRQPPVETLRRKMRGLVLGGRDESERRRAESQWIVAARPLCHLQYPVAYLSRLQRILPAA